jgi:ADP-ribose pyrophosphatase YjhB (NUDIX family)
MNIESELYTRIIENLPILCVDGLIIKDDKILLLKRINEPAKGEWWFPGGRVFKNEKINQSIIRKVKEETNLDVEIVKQIAVCETIFEKKHTVNICFSLKPINDEVILNYEHEKYCWFDLSELPNLDERILNIIKIIKNNNENTYS